MKNYFVIILTYSLFLSGVSAETFTTALKKAYTNNPELNAERESLNISEQELNISKGSYLPTVTLSGSKSEEKTDKLTNRDGSNASITNVDPTVKSITIEQTLIDFGRGAELAKSKIGIDLAKAKLLKKEKYTKMYEILEKVMINKKKIHPNVDFPCGPTYYMMGIDIDFYTPIFVMSRITGWSAHIMEQHASNKLIRPLSKYRGAEVREVMLLNQR